MPDRFSIENQIERDERAMERIAVAFEHIAAVAQAWYNRTYPVRSEASDATVTHIPTPEDALKEDQGATGEPLDDWLTDVIGPREQKLVEGELAKGSVERDPTKS